MQDLSSQIQLLPWKAGEKTSVNNGSFCVASGGLEELASGGEQKDSEDFKTGKF